MKAKRIALGSLILVVQFCFIQFASAAARAPGFRYRFTEGQTNAYKIEIEVRDENGTNTLTGSIIVTPKASASNTFSVNLRGTLLPRRMSMPRPMFNGSGYSQGLQPITMQNESCEIQFDDFGRILRETGDHPLPIPLGSIAQIIIEPFPPNAESRWETTDERSVMDEPFSLGPTASFLPTQMRGMSYYNQPFNTRSGGPAVLRVTRKLRYEVKSLTQERTVINKQLTLESHLREGREPRLNASGEGQIVFDRAAGLIRQFDFQSKTVANTDALTRRTTISLRVKLLEGAEREAALQPPVVLSYSSSEPGRKLSADELQKIIADFKSPDKSVRSQAASKLLSTDLSQPSPELLELMAGALNDTETGVRWAAARVLSDGGTTEHVPLLLKLLKSSDSSGRSSAIRGLGRLKDQRAVDPLIGMIAAGGSDAYQAVEALGNIGSKAEDAVLALLKERHIETQRHACRILKEIGTTKSLEPLRELMLDSDHLLSSSATEAIREIKSRQ